MNESGYDYCNKICGGHSMFCGTGGCIANDPAWIYEKEPERFEREFPELAQQEYDKQGARDGKNK